MKRTILAMLGVLSLLLFIGAPASAQDDDEEDYDDAYSFNGAYLLVQAVTSLEVFERVNGLLIKHVDNLKVDNRDKVSPGISARLGYRFHRRFSLEAQFTWIEEWKFEEGDTTAMILENSVSGMLNLKYYFMTARFQPYGILGGGVTRMRQKPDQVFIDSHGYDNEKSTGLSAQAGLGFDYYLTDAVGLNLEMAYQRQFADDLDKFNTINGMAGIFLRF